MQLITPQEASLKIMNEKDYLILDVREPYEYSICHIKAKHIPMGELSSRVEELDKEQKVIVMCKTGKRAEAVANFLEQEFQFQDTYVLEGGIINWIEQIQPNLESY